MKPNSDGLLTLRLAKGFTFGFVETPNQLRYQKSDHVTFTVTLIGSCRISLLLIAKSFSTLLHHQ